MTKFVAMSLFAVRLWSTSGWKVVQRACNNFTLLQVFFIGWCLHFSLFIFPEPDVLLCILSLSDCDNTAGAQILHHPLIFWPPVSCILQTCLRGTKNTDETFPTLSSSHGKDCEISPPWVVRTQHCSSSFLVRKDQSSMISCFSLLDVVLAA